MSVLLHEIYFTVLQYAAEMKQYEDAITNNENTMSKILTHVHTLDHTAANAVTSDAGPGSFLYWPDHVDAATALAANDRESIPFDVVKVLGPLNNTMITMPTPGGLVHNVIHNILVHRNGQVTLLSGGNVVGDSEAVYTLDDVPVIITEEVVRYG